MRVSPDCQAQPIRTQDSGSGGGHRAASPGRNSVAAVTGPDGQASDECMAVGILEVEEDTLNFRHELARQIVLDTISPLRKQALHRLVLDTLKSSPPARKDLARLAHHAEASGDQKAVLEYAPAAAKLASAAGAHRAAAALYELTLRFAAEAAAGGTRKFV